MDSQVAAVGRETDYVDERFEFDAPRYHNFEVTTTSSEENTVDAWFSTSATKRLATPEGVGDGQRLENCEDGKERAMYHTETHRRSGELSMSFDHSEASRRESEVAHVRAVLAHITNNVSRVNQVSQKSNVFRGNKMTVTTTENMNVQQSSKFTVGHNDQENQPEDFCPSAPVEVVKFPTRPLPGAQTRSQAANITSTSTRGPAEVTGSLPPPPPPSRPAKKEEAPPPARRSKPRAAKLTVPKSPFLRSKQRSTVHRQQVTKTTEEMELEKLGKAREEAKALRRRNAKSVSMVLHGPQNLPNSETREVTGRNKGTRTVAPKRPITEPKEFEFRTAKRQRVHGMQTRSMLDPDGRGIARGTNGARPSPWRSTAQRVAQFTCGRTSSRQAYVSSSKQETRRNNAAKKPKLTKPKTPRFATTARQRSSRFKPTEEEELEKAVKEARAMRNRLNQAKAPASVTGPDPPHRNQRQQSQQQRTSKPIQSKPFTQAQPFSFATDTRAAHRKEKLQHSHQPPRTVAPPPFVFGLTGERRVTRSQATNHSLATGPRLQNESSGKPSPADVVQTAATKSADEENVPAQVDSFEELRRQSNGIRRKTTFLSGKARRVLRTEDDGHQLKDDGDGNGDGDDKKEDGHAKDRGVNNWDDSLSGLDTEVWRMDEGDGQKDRMQDIIRAGTTLHNPLFRL